MIADPPIHQCPDAGSAIMPCCGRTPFDVPRGDGLTTLPDLVTCGELTDEDWQIWHAIHVVRIDRAFDLAADSFTTAVQPFMNAFVVAAEAIVTALAEAYQLSIEKPSARRRRMKAARNAAEHSQPWAPGVITKKSRKR
jgi:hypothetical protein